MTKFPYRGCGDSSCIFGPPGGMATNVGCRCLARVEDHTPSARRDVTQGILQMRVQIRELQEELTRHTHVRNQCAYVRGEYNDI